MIQSLQEQELVLTSNTAPVTFNDTDLRTASANCFNGWLNHNEGSAQFNIVAGGIYEIDFTANVTSATAGSIALGIFTDGVKLNGGEANTVIAAAGDYDNISIHNDICDLCIENLNYIIELISNDENDDNTDKIYDYVEQL